MTYFQSWFKCPLTHNSWYFKIFYLTNFKNSNNRYQDTDCCELQLMFRCIMLWSMSLTFLNAWLGGQKSRVAFAKITFKKPHIILLDEPSNHLVGRPISPTFYFASWWVTGLIVANVFLFFFGSNSSHTLPLTSPHMYTTSTFWIHLVLPRFLYIAILILSHRQMWVRYH